MINFQLSGPVFVTGGGSGIGRETCLQAARSGASVGIVDRNEDAARAVVGEITALGGKAAWACADVAASADLTAALARLSADLGPARYLVAAAGISRTAAALSMSESQWADVFAVNLTGAFTAARAVAPGMIAAGQGSIVMVSSVSGTGGHAARTNYAASKAALISLTKSLAIEWGRLGVRVNAVLPGPVDTPLLRGSIPQDHVNGVMIDRNPMARLSTASEQAQPILFLLSQAAGFVNGTTLIVDGGLTAGPFIAQSGADLGARNL